MAWHGSARSSRQLRRWPPSPQSTSWPGTPALTTIGPSALAEVLTETLATGRTPGGCTLGTRQGARPHVVVTMSAKTFAGDDDAPAYLAGYGPITAGAARAIADDQARYSTVFTDPVDGTYRSDGNDSAALRHRLPFLPSDEAWVKVRDRLRAPAPLLLSDDINNTRSTTVRAAPP